MDRAYRIGQTKEVIVYRLIMAGSVEEKMYEKQVFKDGIRVVTENGGASSRYFSSKETKDLFSLGPVGRCLVLEKLRLLSSQHHIEGLPEPIAAAEDLDETSSTRQDDNEGDIRQPRQPTEDTRQVLYFSLGLTRHDILYNDAKNTDQPDPTASDRYAYFLAFLILAFLILAFMNDII